MKGKFQLLLVCLIALFSAKCEDDPIDRFVEEYEEENFDPFINKGFLIRSRDREGNIQLFIATDKENAFNNGPFMVEFKKGTNQIISTSTHLMSDTSSLDRTEIKKLIPDFLKYQVYSLSVDNDKNVFIRLEESDQPTLVRFSDEQFKTKKYEGWKKINSKWYRKD